jgi:peptidoglycan/LPS O-acetylase OafA/YrhL
VEVQFYLIWPCLLWIGLRYRRTRSGPNLPLAAASLLLAAASAVTMALLYQPGYDPTRVYDGTDTRAFALLIGSALAFVWPSRRLRHEVAPGARWVLDGAGIAGLAIFAVLVSRTSERSPFLYPGGMILLSFGAALMVAAAASPASRFGRVLGWRPLRWLGVRSYGIYLWHFPIIVLTTPADGRDTLARGVLQVAASIGGAALSGLYHEGAIRHAP